MVAHTVLLDFTVSSTMISDVEKRSNLKSTIANVLGEHIGSLKPLTEINIEESLLLLYTGVRGSLITVRAYPKGLVTVNIEYYKGDNEEALLNFEVSYIYLNSYQLGNIIYPTQTQLFYFWLYIYRNLRLIIEIAMLLIRLRRNAI